MGFGYGTKINEYRIKPGELPKGLSKKHIIFATKKDRAALDACYHRVMAESHGLIRRTKTYIRMLTRPGNFIIACKRRNKIEGFIVYSFKTSKDDNWLNVEMNILEFIYESREAFLELVAFLQSQSDQVHCISHKTQDDFFHFVPHDARTDSGRLIFPVGHETNTQGIGIMYRVIDTVYLFRRLKKHDFNGQTCRLKITVDDSFYPKHAGSYIVHFDMGRPQVKSRGAVDAEITLDVADFSSLVMGVVPFDRLYEYGRAEISNTDYLDTVTKIFSVARKPVCVTQF
jgi:predicted acetyltransferase